jgi:hypothetical protein
VLSHDWEVVTGAACVPWLELVLPLSLELPLPAEAPLSLEPLSLCVEPLSLELLSLCVDELLSLCVLVEEPAALGAFVVVVDVPPLPRAATASQAVTNVASTPAVTRRRTLRRRCLTGGTGVCMRRIVAYQAWIFLGIRSASGKSRALRFLFGAS